MDVQERYTRLTGFYFTAPRTHRPNESRRGDEDSTATGTIRFPSAEDARRSPRKRDSWQGTGRVPVSDPGGKSRGSPAEKRNS